MLDPDRNTDAALTGTSEAGATVWTGLDHLEGLTVTVKGDGVALQDRVVTGGQITIERPANAIEVGLGYVTTILTLTPEVSVPVGRSEEHTSELQSLMRISYAVFCLKKNKSTIILG